MDLLRRRTSLLSSVFCADETQIILSLPEVIPVTAENMNYAAPITAGVMLMSLVWYMVPGGGKVHYTGPRNIIQEELDAIQNNTYEEDEDKAEKSSV